MTSGLTAIVEVGRSSSPTDLREQVELLLAGGIPVVAAFSGPARVPLRHALRGVSDPSLRQVSAASAHQARVRALRRVATDSVVFLPGGWEVDAGRLAELVPPPGGARGPVVRNRRGGILGLGFIWWDTHSSPVRLLGDHPAADADLAEPLPVPALGPEGLACRVADVRRLGLLDSPDWAVRLTCQLASETVPGVSVAVPRFTPPLPRDRSELPGAPRWVEESREALRRLGWWASGVDRGALVLARTNPVAQRRWAIKIGAPPGRRGDRWGDVFFAEDLAAALRSLGNDVVIDRGPGEVRATQYLDQVVLTLREMRRVPRQPAAVNILWVISHPDDVTAEEMREHDVVFAASTVWPQKQRELHGLEVRELLQATDPERFRPECAEPDTGPDLLFVGNSRFQMRPIIADCDAAGLAPTIIGQDWGQFLPPGRVLREHLPNAELPAAYRSAGIVLNDHWPDMAREGFLNNRLFDAVAAGARVVSDHAPGIERVFGDSVAVYRSPADLAVLCAPANRGSFGDARMIAERARRLGSEHSFLARARELMAAAARVPTITG